MNAPRIPDEIVEMTARAQKPHLWNGKLCDALAKSASFNDAQAKDQVDRKRNEIREEVRSVLEIAAPALIAAERSERDAARAELSALRDGVETLVDVIAEPYHDLLLKLLENSNGRTK